VELIETSAFTKQVAGLLSDDEYGEFQSRLAANPDLGSLIKGGGGIRKIRIAVGSRGKRGGGRVVYYWAVRSDLILLLYAYSKNVTADLTPNRWRNSPRWSGRSSAMKAKMFEELLDSVREGGAILRGEKKPSRRFEIGSSGIRAIRERTRLSQSDFASLMGVSVKTLQNWEQDRRRPTGPAVALLRIIAYEPKLAMKAIQQV
jgi:putative transcriptional regulator